MGVRFEEEFIIKKLKELSHEKKEIYLRFEFSSFFPLEIVYLPYLSYLKIVDFKPEPSDLVVVATPYICLCSTLSSIDDRVITAYEDPDERVLKYDLSIVFHSVSLFFSLSKKLSTSLSTTYS